MSCVPGTHLRERLLQVCNVVHEGLLLFGVGTGGGPAEHFVVGLDVAHHALEPVLVLINAVAADGLGDATKDQPAHTHHTGLPTPLYELHPGCVSASARAIAATVSQQCCQSLATPHIRPFSSGVRISIVDIRLLLLF